MDIDKSRWVWYNKERENEICAVCIMECYFAYGEDTHTLRKP